MKINAKGLATVLVLSLLLSLCGCEKQRDSMKEGLASLKSSGSSGDAVGGEGNKVSNALYKQLEIPEEIAEIPLTEQGNHAYSVHAGVLVPDEAVPGIFKECKVTIDIDYINRMAEKLLKKLADKESETYYADKIRYTEILTLLKEQSDEMTVSTYQEGDFTKAGYAVCRYNEIYILEGEVSGVVYQLAAYKLEEQVNIRIIQMTEGYPELYPGGDIENSLYGLSSDGDETSSKVENPVVGESRDNSMPDSKSTRQSYEKALEEECLKYSEEEAAKLACSFMEQLVSEDMETNYTVFRTGAHADCYALRDLNETPFDGKQGNSSIDGYRFGLQRRIRGLSCENLGEVRTLTDNGETVTTEQEYYEVEISNRGVVNVRINSPVYEVMETMEEAPELMKFSEITEIMENALKEETQFLVEEQGYGNDIYLINRIALSYVTVQYDKEYVLIPAWCFQEATDGAGVGDAYLIISAVDGSILYRPEHESELE